VSDNRVLTQFDDWLKDDSKTAALVMRQWLKPVEEVAFGDDEKAVVFPPTYATGDNKSPYNIDRFDDGTSVCQIDSVGSQANRMEPIFKQEEYKLLVPEVIIETNNGPINLLDAGHRAADAVVRFTFGPTEKSNDQEQADKNKNVEPLGQQLWNAYQAWNTHGDAEKLARIAPTSIVFGSWDSRATQAKLPRIVRSVIRAYNIKELTRSAQYSTIAGQILGEGEAETQKEGKESELGLSHVPAVGTHGGVEVHGGIRRDSMINLVALRSMSSSSSKNEDNLKLRRYILGLALVALTADQDGFLREGCHLVPDESKPAQWSLVRYDGSKDAPPTLEPLTVKPFAEKAAEAFNVTQRTITATFDSKLANELLTLSKDARKKVLRQGPIASESLNPSGGGLGASLKKKKVPELKEECEQHGLSTDGKKGELIDRLLEFHDNKEQSAPESKEPEK
jgi:CRISPR-associated protein Csb1